MPMPLQERPRRTAEAPLRIVYPKKPKKAISPTKILQKSLLWDNRLVKSADPVTYDDNGNVIPLSERFNSFNPDMRFALTDYTKEQYNSLGWVRANEILSVGQNEDYRTKFSKAVNGSKNFKKTSTCAYNRRA